MLERFGHQCQILIVSNDWMPFTFVTSNSGFKISNPEVKKFNSAVHFKD